MDQFKRLLDHHVWSLDKILKISYSLPHENLHRVFAIGQGSIWRSLCHLVAADQIWLASLQGNPVAVFKGDNPDELPGNQKADDAFRSLEELESYWRGLLGDWEAYLSNLEEKELAQLAFRKSSSSFGGRTIGVPKSDVILHLFLHAHYTKAQIINMFRQLGVTDLPDPMLMTLARQEALAAR